MDMAVERARLFKLAAADDGKVHGDAPDGSIDIEFPDMDSAVRFAGLWTCASSREPALLAACDIRQGDSVTSLKQVVVLTVTMTLNEAYPSVLMYTADRHLITHGLRVWDYDLDHGTVDLEYRKPFQENGEWWFYVHKDGQKHPGLMSETRVCVVNPHTGKRA